MNFEFWNFEFWIQYKLYFVAKKNHIPNTRSKTQHQIDYIHKDVNSKAMINCAFGHFYSFFIRTKTQCLLNVFMEFVPNPKLGEFFADNFHRQFFFSPTILRRLFPCFSALLTDFDARLICWYWYRVVGCLKRLFGVTFWLISAFICE